MAEPTAPTPRELEIIFVAFQCLKDTPRVDYKKLASTGLYKNAHSASSNWSTLRKKIFRSDGVPVLATGGTGSGSTEPRTPRKNTARGGKGTPKTGGGRGKGKGGKATVLTAEIVGKGDSDSDAEVGVAVKRERDDDDGEGERESKKAKRGGKGGKNVKAEDVVDHGTEGGEEGVHDGEC